MPPITATRCRDDQGGEFANLPVGLIVLVVKQVIQADELTASAANRPLRSLGRVGSGHTNLRARTVASQEMQAKSTPLGGHLIVFEENAAARGTRKRTRRTPKTATRPPTPCPMEERQHRTAAFDAGNDGARRVTGQSETQNQATPGLEKLDIRLGNSSYDRLTAETLAHSKDGD